MPDLKFTVMRSANGEVFVISEPLLEQENVKQLLDQDLIDNGEGGAIIAEGIFSKKASGALQAIKAFDIVAGDCNEVSEPFSAISDEIATAVYKASKK